jgi:hypothetical protein
MSSKIAASLPVVPASGEPWTVVDATTVVRWRYGGA